MVVQYLYPVILMAATAVISALVAWYAWRWRSTAGGIEFVLLMAAVTVYTGLSAIELAVPDPSVKIIWSKISYIGVVSIAPMWLLFAIHYSQHAHWLTRLRVAALWILPLIVLGLAVTNEWHKLIWPTITPVSSQPGARLEYGHGVGIWVHAVYAYLLMFAGTFLLIRKAWYSQQLYRRQIGLMVVGALLPWTGNLLYLLNYSPLPGFDLTPVAFLVTGLLLSTSISRYHAVDIAPVARDVVFNSMGDGVLVLDTQNRLVDINPVACMWTGLGHESIGRNVFDALQLDEAAYVYKDGTEIHTVLEIGEGDAHRVFDITISPLWDGRRQLQGRVALLHDIRHERALLDAEHQRTAQLTALQSISQAVVSSLDLHQIFETVVNVLHDTFQYRYVSIYRLHNETLFMGAQVGYPDELVMAEIAVNHGVMGRTVRTRQPQWVRDVTFDPDFLRAAYDVQSEICVPLLKEQTVLGTLNVESPPQHYLTDADLLLLITFASQVVEAINNASLFQAEQEQHQLAEALRVMGMALSESLDFEAVLDRLLDEIGKVVPYDAASVLLAGEANRLAQVVRLRGYNQLRVFADRKTVPLVFDIDTTENLSRMAETGKPLIITDIATDPAWADVHTTAHLRSWAGAPITLRGQVIGFLSLDKAEPGFYHPEHTQSLAAFSSQAAIAVENARIFTEMQRRAEKERLLFAATRDFTAGLDTDAVLYAIVNHMVAGLGVDGCTVSRWDKEMDCVVTLLDYNASPDHLVDEPGNMYPLAEYPVTRGVLVNRQPHFLYVDDPAVDPAERALMEKFGNKSLLMLPLIVGRERQVFGIVELFRKEKALPYNQSDLEMAQSFTAQAAVALENARLYAEQQRLAIVDELTGLYNRRGLFELGQRELERATRFKHHLAALFLDIDHFKLFNDRYSYAVGDQVLHLFAECVRANLREFDLIGRYGGEEFAVLLPEADLPSASEVAERVRRSVENLRVITELGETNITVSIGVCVKTPEITDLDALLDRAGQAVHDAKKIGRNRVVVV